MRNRQLASKLVDRTPDHLGVAYERWAPLRTDDGDEKDKRFDEWLTRLAQVTISADYHRHFARWKKGFGGDAHVEWVELQSRMLLGHGNPSGSEVGLTVHHTWGVPIIPGSALKGLLAHRMDILYGPHAELPGPDDEERARWSGAHWDGTAIARGPGQHHRALFGAPDARDDGARRSLGHEAGATAGLVTFHDALYVPGSVKGDRPFARDVLTVHQKSYYDSKGEDWPNDWESPNPVGFISIRPGAGFLLVLTGRCGAADWAGLAMQELLQALSAWGIGGKTSLGYGRLSKAQAATAEAVQPTQADLSAPPQTSATRQLSARFQEFTEFFKSSHLNLSERLRIVEQEWSGRLLGLDITERRRAATLIEKRAEKKGPSAAIQELLRKLREES